MHRTRLRLLALVGVLVFAGGCKSGRGSTIQASDLPQATAGRSEGAAPGGAGAVTQGAGQGAVTGRPIDGAPGATGPGGGADAQGQQQVALGPTVETPAGPVQEVGALRDVYFEFDSASLGQAARETLGYNANWMERHPQARVLIEGHTDQRGSVAYNLALGERRAVAARDYLVSLGIVRQRLSTISYGKERPADPRMSEEAWTKNRRAHFVVVTQASGAQQ